MDCYYHSGAAAVGTCKSCHRGICRACAAEVTDAICCIDRCEQQAAAMSRAWKLSAKAYALFALYTMAFGVIFAARSIRDYQRWESTEAMPIAMAIVFIGTGTGLALIAYKLRRSSRDSPS